MTRNDADRIIRTVYTATLAGDRPINTFKTDGNLIDLAGYLVRNYFSMSDLVKVIKTEYTIIQDEDGVEKFVVEEDVTEKFISDSLVKIMGRRAEDIVFDNLEKVK